MFIIQCSYILPYQKLLIIQELKLKEIAHKCTIQQHLVLNRLHTANFCLFDASQDRDGSDNLNLLLLIIIILALHINPFFPSTPTASKSQKLFPRLTKFKLIHFHSTNIYYDLWCIKLMILTCNF